MGLSPFPKTNQDKNKKCRPPDKQRAHEPVTKLEDVIDLQPMSMKRSAADPRNSLISARLFILAQVFLSKLLMRLDRHAAVAPQMKTERANPAKHRHHSAKKKPDRNRHVLGRLSVFGAVTKRTCQSLLRANQDRYEQAGDANRFSCDDP